MIPNFARTFSLEATRPNAGEIAALADLLPAGTPVYFTAVPTVGPQEVIEAAVNLRKAGLEPVVHIAARRMPARLPTCRICSPACAAKPMCAGCW